MSVLVTRQRRRVLAIAATATTMAPAPLTSASAADPGFGYQGSAFGSSVTVLGTVESAPTAQISFGCGTPAGLDRTATSAGISVPPSLASTGVITTTGSTSASPIQSKTTAQVASVNVLGGLITANTLTSVSVSSKGSNGFATSAAGTTFVGLQVLGLPVLLGPAPNTRIDLPGVGFVILNEQSGSVTANSAALRVTSLRAKVTQANLLGFAIGTEVVIAQAFSQLTAPAGGFLGGFAYGTAAQV
nr:hypothetical protein [Geodermatophilaceae bacterium]